MVILEKIQWIALKLAGHAGGSDGYMTMYVGAIVVTLITKY